MKVPGPKRNAYLKAAKGSARPPKGQETPIGVWRPLPETQLQKDPELKPDEQEKVKELRAYVDSELALPESDDYYKMEQKYLNAENCMYRFLKASDWKMPEAKERVKKTLEWRRDYKPDLIAPDEIREETEGGKIIVSGFDNKGRPVMYLRPARENTDPSPTQIRHMIWALERAVDLLPPHVSKLFLIIDYAGATSKSNPSMKTAKQVVDILQNHYAERLGQAVVVNCPWYLKGIFSTISPFLDPATREKLQMNPNLKKMIPLEQLDAEFGGSYNFKYDWQIYLPALSKYCGILDDGTRSEGRPLLAQSMSQASQILHKENGEGSPSSKPEAKENAEATASAADNASDSGSATAVESNQGDDAAMGEKKKTVAFAKKRTGTEVSTKSETKSQKKAKKQRRSFLACFGPNGLDDDDPALKAEATRGVNSGNASSDVATRAANEQEALEHLKAAHPEVVPEDLEEASPAEKKKVVELALKSEMADEEKANNVDPVQAQTVRNDTDRLPEADNTLGSTTALQDGVNQPTTSTSASKGAQPATVTESLTKAATDELAILQGAASQLLGNVWPASASQPETSHTTETSTSSSYLPAMPAISMPSMPAIFGGGATSQDSASEADAKPAATTAVA